MCPPKVTDSWVLVFFFRKRYSPDKKKKKERYIHWLQSMLNAEVHLCLTKAYIHFPPSRVKTTLSHLEDKGFLFFLHSSV